MGLDRIGRPRLVLILDIARWRTNPSGGSRGGSGTHRWLVDDRDGGKMNGARERSRTVAAAASEVDCNSTSSLLGFGCSRRLLRLQSRRAPTKLDGGMVLA